MVVFRLIAVGLFLGLVTWVIYGIVAPAGYHPAPETLDLGSAFTGDLALSADTIKAVFNEARATMLHLNEHGSWLRRAGDVSGWLSFASTSAITLIAGFFGRMPHGEPTDLAASGLSMKSVRLIAFLASLAAVLTAFGSLSISKSQEYFTQADGVRDLILHSRDEVLRAQTPEAAQTALDDLAGQVQRLLIL